MTKNELVLIYLGVFCVLLLLDSVMFGYLKMHHQDTYEKLGSPSFKGSNIGKGGLERLMFIWGLNFLLLRDAKLSVLCFLHILIGGVCWYLMILIAGI